MSFRPYLYEPGACASYLPAGAGVQFDHVPLADGDRVELGRIVVEP